MHYVNIRITSEGLDDGVRARLVRDCTALLCRVLSAQPAEVMVVIDEMPLPGIGMGGVAITEFRRQLA